jgi:hypothetical protein
MVTGVSIVTAIVLSGGAVVPGVVAAPSHLTTSISAPQQNVGWMSSDTASYLGSVGMDVMVPSWIPAPFEGVAPDVYAGDGSYSLYWLGGGDVPTFLHITGVVGAAFPDGSKADLNIPLSVNTSVQGWPAIQDFGIPAGSETPIYDQVWWIADGVRYSVESNNIGAASMTIANSMVYLEAPAPVVEEPVYTPPTEVPYVPVEEPVAVEPAAVEPDVRVEATDTPLDPVPVTNTTVDEVTVNEETTTTQTEAAPATDSSTSAEQPWSPDRFDSDVPSDGTAGPRPPVIGGDGTGGLFDTSLPRIPHRP